MAPGTCGPSVLVAWIALTFMRCYGVCKHSLLFYYSDDTYWIRSEAGWQFLLYNECTTYKCKGIEDQGA